MDSSPGILASLAYAFEANDARPNRQLDCSLIGPPLRSMVDSLLDYSDSAIIDLIISDFKEHYDSIGYLKTSPFKGVRRMLDQLSCAGIRLNIATNKRSLPTQQILSALGWCNYFDWVYSSDSKLPPFASKTDLLAQLLRDARISVHSCIYVGDRAEDWYSAQANGLRFGWAQWGFMDKTLNIDDDSLILSAPDAAHFLGRSW